MILLPCLNKALNAKTLRAVPGTLYNLRECVLEVERLDSQSRRIGIVRTVCLEEFELAEVQIFPIYMDRDRLDVSASLLKFDFLAAMLRHEMGFDRERELLYCVQYDRTAGGFREINSDISLRGAVRLLRTSGGYNLRLYIKKKTDFGIKEKMPVHFEEARRKVRRKLKEGVTWAVEEN